MRSGPVTSTEPTRRPVWPSATLTHVLAGRRSGAAAAAAAPPVPAATAAHSAAADTILIRITRFITRTSLVAPAYSASPTCRQSGGGSAVWIAVVAVVVVLAVVVAVIVMRRRPRTEED